MREIDEHKAQRLRGRLVAALAGQGVLDDAGWRAAFEEVPRHVFLPRFFRPRPAGGWSAVSAEDPDWLSLVYSDRVWVTQLDSNDGRWHTARRTGRVDGAPTSSSSMPVRRAVSHRPSLE